MGAEVLIADVRQDREGDGERYQVMIVNVDWGSTDVFSWVGAGPGHFLPCVWEGSY